MPLRFRILQAQPGLGLEGMEAGPSGLAPGPTEERCFEVLADLDEVNVGRQPGTTIELPFPAVSSLHARLFRAELPTDWWVEDLGSMNGTWVDGQRLAPRRPVSIRAGQRLRIATVAIVFEGWSKSPRGAESTASIARRLISDLFGVIGGEVPTLSIESGPAHPSTVRLTIRDRRYTTGRADDCDLVLSSEHVSREHAVFVRRWDGVVVFDLGSKNGVRVNGRLIGAETRLSDGDRVEISPIAIRFSDPEDRYLRRLESLGNQGMAEARPHDAAGSVSPAEPPSAAPSRGTGPTPTSTPILSVPPVAVAESAPPAGVPAPGARRTPSWGVVVLVAAVVAAVAGLLVLLIATR